MQPQLVGFTKRALNAPGRSIPAAWHLKGKQRNTCRRASGFGSLRRHHSLKAVRRIPDSSPDPSDTRKARKMALRQTLVTLQRSFAPYATTRLLSATPRTVSTRTVGSGGCIRGASPRAQGSPPDTLAVWGLGRSALGAGG